MNNLPIHYSQENCLNSRIQAKKNWRDEVFRQTMNRRFSVWTLMLNAIRESCALSVFFRTADRQQLKIVNWCSSSAWRIIWLYHAQHWMFLSCLFGSSFSRTSLSIPQCCHSTALLTSQSTCLYQISNLSQNTIKWLYLRLLQQIARCS